MSMPKYLSERRGFIGSRRSPHHPLTGRRHNGAMMTRRMKIRRHLRSVRTSALTEEERRLELREAEARSAHGRGKPAEPEASPSLGDGSAHEPTEACSEWADVSEPG
jgi:hypothetical protein